MRKIVTFVIAGTACSIAGAQSNLDVERAYAAELAADASNRSSLLQGASSGSGFTLTSGDGSSTLTTNAFFQFRYVANWRDDGGTDQPGAVPPTTIGDNDFTHGFEIPRARIDWSGNLINDNITYRISGDFGDIRSPGNDFGVTWAYGQYAFEGMDGAFVRWGQFKAPLLWEELVDPEFQLAGDRSVVNETFSQQYSQGIMFGYEADAWRGYFAITDGLNTAGTNYNGGGEADIGLTLRAEFKFAGDWARFTDFTSWRNSDYAGKVGAAIHWETYGDSSPPNVGSGAPVILGAATSGSLLVYTVDAAVEGNGWNAFVAFIGGRNDDDAPGAQDFDDFGLVAQAGIFVTEQVELFGRWDALFLDDDRGFDDDMHFLTFGANYYVFPESHAVKASLELLWALSDNSPLLAGGLFPGSGGGVTPTSYLGQDEDGEIAIRAQIGVLF
jgi:hypothetical protein